MSVIRVGFVLTQVGWLGGINYLRNLFTAIQLLPDTKIRPVVFVGLKADIGNFDGMAEIIRTPILDRYTLLWWTSQFFSRVFPRRDYLIYWLLRNHRIDVLSHFGRFWRGCSIPSIGWIPDFQHLHLPKFFDEKELTIRNKQFMEIIRCSDAVLVSSQDALNDLNGFCPENTTPTHILRFVSCLHPHFDEQPSRAELVMRYGLDGPWFHVPNQFWAHKNHGVIIEALRVLKLQGNCPLVTTTGSTKDDRNPDYFPSLMKLVSDYDLEKNFRVLGVLPYSDVVSLMRYSVAIINPSEFEGWSTSVEEAKTMEKKIILSDISVHREQNPKFGYYFNANDKNALAKLIDNFMHQNENVEENVLAQENSQLEQNARMKLFAKQYEEIVSKVTQGQV